MPNDVKQQRNAAIAAALRGGGKVPELMQQYGLSRASIFRAAKQAQAFAAPAPSRDPAPTGSAAQINLYAERGRSGLRRFGGSVDDDYDRVFRTLRNRMALYREMGDDPIVAAVLQAIKMTLRRVSWYVETDGETEADQQAVEFLESCLDDMSQSWTDTIDQALGMLQYGFYPAETVYKPRRGDREQVITVTVEVNGRPAPMPVTLPPSKYDDGRIGWRKWVFLAPETLAPGDEWVFDEHGGLLGLNQQAPPNYDKVFIPIEKLVNFRTTAERGNPEGRSILRAMYKPWYFKNNLEEVEAISAERFGTGLPVAYLGEGTARNGTEGDDLATFMDIVRNVRIDEQSGLVIPYAKMGGGAKDGEGVLFEFVTPPGTGPVNFAETITRHEQRMTMVGLAQFIHLGMNGVGARALGESGQDFFTLAVSAWADGVADTINRYGVDRLFKVNSFPGLTAVPRIAHEAVAQTDLKSVADYINALTGKELITPTEELERYLLELADLPVGQRISEVWAAKEKARDTALANAATAAPPATAAADANAPVAGKDAGGAAQDDAAAAELASEVRAARELLAESMSGGQEIDDVKAEQFLAELRATLAPLLARQAAPAAAPFNLTLKEGSVQLPEGFGAQPPVDMSPVADAIRAVGAAQQVNAERFADAVKTAVQPTIVVQVPEQAPPNVTVNVPPAVVNVAPAPAPIVNVPPLNLQPIADAVRDAGQTEETLTIERDQAGLMTSAKKTRKRKGG